MKPMSRRTAVLVLLVTFLRQNSTALAVGVFECRRRRDLSVGCN
jgi:hypothetical protein